METDLKLKSIRCCLICGGKKIYYNFSIEKYRIEECADCRIMRLNPQPTDEELASIYHTNYFLTGHDEVNDFSHVSKLKSSTADYYLDLLQAYTAAPLTGCLLEVGCGQGDFLLQAAKRGLAVTGVEYAPPLAEIAAKNLGNKGQIICGEITQLPCSAAQFDYIVFVDVIEHVRDPREFLRHAYSLLKKNGVAVVITPSTDSFLARSMKNKWMEFKPEHLWYFSTATFRRLLYSEGFGQTKALKAKKTLSMDYITEHFNRYPVQPFTWLLQFTRRLFPRFIRKYPIHINAGSLMMLARKQEIHPTRKLSIIMAVYNEENTVRQTIESVLAKKIDTISIELIIVESKSSDNTRHILREYEGKDRIKIIYQDHPYGKGNAIREGLSFISGEFILIQDADDEYDFEDYDALVAPLISGEATFVLGARHGGRTWKMRQFNGKPLAGHLLNLGHWFFTLLINVFFGVRLKDPFTMFKVFRVDCLHNIKLECNRFDFDFELLIKLIRTGHKPIEIPVNYRSRSFKEGKKIRVVRDPLTWLYAIIKFRLQKMNR